MRVLVIFGSQSDKNVYEPISHGLRKHGVNVTVRALSAHRTPREVDELPFEDFDAVIAGAGLAAHLPGVVAARTTSAVIGVPCNGAYDGLDSWLSIVQMPPGIPVLGVGVGRGEDAVKAIEALKKGALNIQLCYNKESEIVAKAKKTLESFDIKFTQAQKPSANTINILFAQKEDEIEVQGVTIVCPVSAKSTAHESIEWLQKAQKGLWVGLNRAENAAIAAVQLTRTHREKLREYKDSLRIKALEADKENKEMEPNKQFMLEETDFPSLGAKYEGKVRDNYTQKGKRIIITTDRLSAFDRIVASIPWKGQVLNEMAAFWFDKTKDIVANHVISVPDPNAMVVKECEPVMVEVVVREYLTGVTKTSIWYNYQHGVRNFCGNELPEGMTKDQKLERPIITPSTKAEKGEHDESISPAEVVKRGLLTKDEMDEISKISFALFERGKEIVSKQGIILVDTKYEFGKLDGKFVLIDEIHTPDSSRFWYKDTYQQLFESGEEQKRIDKEYVRTWLANHNFTGDGEIPVIPKDVVDEASRRYIEAYEKITGQKFIAHMEMPVLERLKQNLKKAGYLQ